MKILVIGATGMIGSRVLDEALERGHSVVAASRNPDKIEAREGVSPIKLDITDSDAVAAAAESVDVVVAAASPRSTGDPVSEAQANVGGAVTGAEKAGKRLVIVGGSGTLNLEDGTPVAAVVPDAYKAEVIGMRLASCAAMNSAAEWTYFAPAGLIQPGEKTGNYRLGTTIQIADAEGKSFISAEDYAAALVDEIEEPKHTGKIFTIGY
jgi:hypothetical protein